MKIYIHQFLARSGLFSSKPEVIEAIRSGQVTINKKPMTNPFYQFNTNKPVTYKGKLVENPGENIYIVINKPVGYISTRLSETDKKLGKKSVFELVKTDMLTHNSLFAVGRLDEDTSGLLIITNDGKLGITIALPGFITKTYEAHLEKKINDDDLKKIEQGVTIKLEVNRKYEDYKTKPCKIMKVSEKTVRIILSEGKKREARRIFEAVQNKVVSLERIAIGNMDKDSLKLPFGKYIALKKEELIKKLGLL